MNTPPPMPEALFMAYQLDREQKFKHATWEADSPSSPIASMLRTQHAALERKDALLRQALEVLGCTHDGEDDPGHRCGHCDDYVDRNGTLRAAIRKELQ